jgi:hypothetical protein
LTFAATRNVRFPSIAASPWTSKKQRAAVPLAPPRGGEPLAFGARFKWLLLLLSYFWGWFVGRLVPRRFAARNATVRVVSAYSPRSLWIVIDPMQSIKLQNFAIRGGWSQRASRASQSIRGAA